MYGAANDAAAVRQKSEKGHGNRCLTGTGFPHQSERLSRRNLEGHSLNRRLVRRARGKKPHTEVPHLKQTVHLLPNWPLGGSVEFDSRSAANVQPVPSPWQRSI